MSCKTITSTVILGNKRHTIKVEESLEIEESTTNMPDEQQIDTEETVKITDEDGYTLTKFKVPKPEMFDEAYDTNGKYLGIYTDLIKIHVHHSGAGGPEFDKGIEEILAEILNADQLHGFDIALKLAEKEEVWTTYCFDIHRTYQVYLK